MSAYTNVVRRQGSRRYYARIAVPKNLQTKLRKREIWKSLGTTDIGQAKRLARPIVEQWERDFEAAAKPLSLTDAELQNAIWSRYVALISSDEKFRRALPSEGDLDEIWRHLEKEFGEYELDAYRILQLIRDQFEVDQRDRTARLAQLKRDTARGDTALVADVVRSVIEERRLDLDGRGEDYRKLAQGIQRADLEALTRSAERDGGDWSGTSRDAVVQPPTAADHKPDEKIMILFDRFRRDKSAATSHDTWEQNRKVVALFDEFVGGNAHVSAVNRKNVRDWKDQLFRWPKRAADTAVFRGLPFANVIEANATIGKPTIQPKTINRYLSALGTFTQWLLAHDYIAEDVMRAMYLDIDRDERTVFPFTTRQLQTIFKSPLFAKCAGDKREHEIGAVAIRDWRYWIPQVGLYTGARLGEIAQLLTADVREIHGRWVFHITREGSRRKSVKTDGSQRVVPMHPKLIELGFLDYHKRMQSFGHEQLFPEIEPDGRGFMSGTPSSFFNDYFRDIGVKTDKSVNFHSFRHGIADAFRSAGYLDEQFAMLLGHTKGTTTGRYGIMPEGILSERVKMIEAVSFPGL